MLVMEMDSFETLYSELVAAERANEDIHSKFEDLQEEIQLMYAEEYELVPGFIMPNLNSILPSVDVKRSQKNILEKYESNYVLAHAIKGITTVENALKGLSENHTGFSRLLPRRKNEDLDEIIDEMAELVSPVDNLRHNGIFSLDNFLNKYLVTSAVVATVASPLAHHYEVNQLAANVAANVMFTFPFATAIFSRKVSPLPWDQARYIDKKVKEFYK